MKRWVALLLAALVLFSLLLPVAVADEGEGGPTSAEVTTPGRTPRPHDKPQWDKSLACWLEEELPALTLTGDLREDIVTVARSQIGYSADKTCYEETESGRKRYYTRYGEWNGATYSDWCDMFVSFCAYFGGAEDFPSDSSCARQARRLKAAGYWREWNSYVPQKGDIVFFAFNQGSWMPNHVGVVEQVILGEGNEPGKLVTIEGNLSNPDGSTACVRRMERMLDQVVGYGTYEQGKIYPETYSVRSDGWEVIGEDSLYFVEYPQAEALRFLGLYGSRYYLHWFPQSPAETAPAEATPPADVEADEGSGSGNQLRFSRK